MHTFLYSREYNRPVLWLDWSLKAVNTKNISHPFKCLRSYIRTSVKINNIPNCIYIFSLYSRIICTYAKKNFTLYVCLSSKVLNPRLGYLRSIATISDIPREVHGLRVFDAGHTGTTIIARCVKQSISLISLGRDGTAFGCFNWRCPLFASIRPTPHNSGRYWSYVGLRGNPLQVL